jgi:hypothetical protein
MSDFFEMRAALERKKAEDADRKLHGRIYQAMLVMLIGVAFGVTSGIDQLEQPVGQVSVSHCKQDCLRSTYLVSTTHP